MSDSYYVSTHNIPAGGFEDISENRKPQCQACGVETTPGDVYEPIIEYRGYLVCKLCRRQWDHLERKYGIEIPIEALCSVAKRREYLGARTAINQAKAVNWGEDPEPDDDAPGEKTVNSPDRTPGPDGARSEDVPLPEG